MNTLLKEIQDTLKDYFDGSYQYSNEMEMKSIPNFHVHSPVLFLAPSNNHVEPTRKKKEQQHSVTKGEIILAGAVATGVSLITVYFVSKDEYIKFYLSKIDSKMKQLSCYDGMSRIINNYEMWKSLHQQRTQKKCISKVTAGGSFLTGITGCLLIGNSLLYGGLIGGSISISYLLWQHLTQNVKKEEEYFRDMIHDIQLACDNISAPPNYDAPPNYEQ